MKTAILIKDGEFQVVLTPEDGFEKNLLSSFATKKLTAKVEMGSFYKCMGGWKWRWAASTSAWADGLAKAMRTAASS